MAVPLELDHRNARTRDWMLHELELDIQQSEVYLNPRLTREGQRAWVGLLQEAFKRGSERTLAKGLRQLGILETRERRQVAPGRWQR